METASDRQFTISYNPATGKEIGQTEQLGFQQLKSIFESAKKSQQNWSELGFKHRAEYLLKVRDYLIKNVDGVAETISNDNGKLVLDALVAEIIPVVIAINYYVKITPKLLRIKRLNPASLILSFKRSYIHRLPLGVIGIIAPWNYPFTIPMFDIVPALLSGNAVIFKGASETQKVAELIKEAFRFSGIPEGVFNVVNMPGKMISEAFLKLGVHKIFLTGSVEAGKQLSRMAAETLTPVSLELGGNDAMIICEDADIERAIGGAIWGGFHNAGQSCGGVERIYIHEKIYDAFLAGLKFRVESMTAGNGADFCNDLGCIATKKQYNFIKSHIDDAVAKGAVIHAESKVEISDEGLFMPAVVLTNVNHDMLVMKEETFGPVVGVMKFKTIEEAIELANDSNLGLTASVWTKDVKSGIEIAKRIKAGAVNINDHLMSHGLAETPWGGFKESGYSRSHGEFAVLAMTQTQVIIKDILPFVKKDLWWHPYSEQLYSGMKGILLMLKGNGVINKLKGFFKVLKIIPRIFKYD